MAAAASRHGRNTAILPPPTPQNVGALLAKIHDNDPDYRFMALSDLRDLLEAGQPGFLSDQPQICARTVDGLVRTLADNNGEVQNMALKCLGPFVNKIPESILAPMIERLSNIETGNAVDQSIPALSLREVVVSLPRPVSGMVRSKAVHEAYTAISKVLIPRLVGYNVISPSQKNLPRVPKGMLESDLEKGTDSNAIDVLTEVARCFGPLLQDVEIQALQKITLEILEKDRTSSMMKKKAVTALAALSIHFPDQLLSSLLSRIIEHLRDVHVTRSQRKIYMTVLGSMARSIPRKFGPYLKTLAPFVFGCLSSEEAAETMDLSDDEEGRDPEVDEVLEAGLIALDAFLASCSQDMRMYTKETIEAATRLLKYDPNLANDDDDDEEAVEEENEDELLEDEDFEEETGYDDDEDASWKIRRCAAKVLYTLISTRGHGDLLDDGTLYDRVAPALVSRFKEREENVRVEIISALAKLVSVSGDGPTPVLGLPDEQTQGTMAPPPSRKRRRGGSDASMFDLQAHSSLSLGYSSPAPAVTPPVGPRASLAKLVPDIITAVAQLLRGTSPPATKEAAIILTKDVVVVQRGGIDTFLDQIMEPVLDIAKLNIQGSIGSASASANSLRIQALQLIGAIADTHSSANIQPYLPQTIPALLAGIRDKYSKLSIEALAASEQIIKALTPPRSASSGSQNQQYLDDLAESLLTAIRSNELELDVRKTAIHVLGLLLGRSSGTQGLLSPQKRAEGLVVLADRLRNELTRLACTRAIDTIVALAKPPADFTEIWVRMVALELGAQLRKASRVLRGASLTALRAICLNPATRQQLDRQSRTEIVGLLLPLLDPADLHLLGPALIILATFAKDDAGPVATPELNEALCRVVCGSVSGSSLEALLVLVRTLGEKGVGSALMQALLKTVGISGNPDVVGKVEGNLLVYGGQSIGVTMEQFVTELQTTNDNRRRCLALAVLGEAALRLGTQSTLRPQLFMDFFNATNQEVPLAAAVALGRAGAGNVSEYLPVILSTMGKSSSPQYLLLHSIKEILQQEGTESDIIPFAEPLWQSLIAASQAEDNKAIGAECIGRLAIIDPKTYLPQLQSFLSDRKSSVRGMVISALRFTLSDTDESYDDYLKPTVIPMLVQMLSEPDLENRRLALTTFNSAMHNKPHIILPALDQLLPLAMKETQIKPELIREVPMGPFKMKVDEGLELRKSAYETLYSLLESAFPQMSATDVSDCFDRVVAGIGDENDIRIICNLMLLKLMVLAPDQTHSRLHSIAENFRAVLSTKPKENAVKQEIEKQNEVDKSVLKVSIQLNKRLGSDSGAHEDSQIRAWNEYWKWINTDLQNLMKAVQDEVKERDT
ncbi:TIP120-domain-containing protein [Westerdykella ornata]|uniref:TIP120-domain-containing protein n=1 Tax=Westerdykella ornata TaxID=318751 RepID=A0A6A6JL86_WESOR|nr:TIP120-domain-containing protein [Westerdykella ornata]KAF2276426.1 TIP120-domain-containing protein [Westerdykella ornata]